MAARVVCVTGANRGIGFEICRQLSLKSAQVDVLVMTGRNSKQLEERREELMKNKDFNNKTKIELFSLDLSDRKSIDSFVKDIGSTDAISGVSCLVNNAGIYIDEWNKKVFDQTLETNILGPMYLTSQLLQQNHFATPFSQIINLSSGYGAYNQISKHSAYAKVATASNLDDLSKLLVFEENDAMKGKYVAAYKVSKAVMNRWTQLLAEQFKVRNGASADKADNEDNSTSAVDQGDEKSMDAKKSEAGKIFINSVCPGWVQTDMGGSSATRTVPQGAYGALRLAQSELNHQFPNGCFFRDENIISFNTGNPPRQRR